MVAYGEDTNIGLVRCRVVFVGNVGTGVSAEVTWDADGGSQVGSTSVENGLNLVGTALSR